MSTEGPSEDKPKPPEQSAGQGIGIVGTSIIVFIIGVVVGVPVANFGANVLVDYAGQVFAILFGIFVVIVLAAALIGLFRRQIWGAIFKRAEIEMERFARPLADVAKFAAEQRVADATSAARDLAELVLARYAWVSTRRWLIATITALIAAIAALAGSALLFQQNNLLRSQMDLMAEQNNRVGEQNRLLEIQIELGEAQRSAGIVDEILELGGLLGAESQALNSSTSDTGISASELSAALRQRLITVSAVAHPYRFLNGGLMNLSEEDLYRIALSRRAELLPPDRRSMFDGLPDPTRSDLTDRTVSPERGQLLTLLGNSYVTDTEALSFYGLDLSFAYVRMEALRYMSLNHATLRFADFSGIRVNTVTFRGAYLENARFVRSIIDHVDFSPIPSGEARQPYSLAAEPMLYTTHAAGIDFTGAHLTDVSFGAMDLLAANFDGTTIAGARFAGATLRGSTFRNAILDRADFTGADLRLVDFDGAITDKADFIAATAAIAVPGSVTPAIYESEPVSREAIEGMLRSQDLLYTGWSAETPLFRIKRIKNFE